MSDRPHDLTRRDALKRMGGGALGLGAGYALPAPVLERFLDLARRPGPWQWAFLTAAELETMNVLADDVIPADARSGSATDSGAVEYVDFILSVTDEERQGRWRDGLAWLDGEARRTHEALVGDLPDSAAPTPAGFADAAPGVRARVLDRIAWPDGATAEYEERARWFSDVRDLVGSGFFSSRMGVEDLGYQGAYMRPSWEGAPREALEELGVSYEKWDARYGDLT